MTRDAGFLLAGRVVSALTTVAVLALIARTRTPDELGVVALGLTISLALAVLPEAGLTSLFIYSSATDPGRTGRLLGSLLVIRAVALPTVFVAIAAAVLVAYPRDAATMMIIAIGPALQQVAELGRAVFVARSRMAVASAHAIAENIAWAGAIGIGAMSGMSLDGMFTAAAVAVSMSVLVSFVLAALLERVVPERPTRPDILDLVQQAGPFTAFSTLAVVAARMDTFLIGLLLPGGIAIAGAYYAVARLVAAAEYVPDAVSRAIYPRLVREFAQPGSSPGSTLAPTARDLTALGVAIPFGFALVGGALIELMYGPDLRAYTWLFVAFGVAMPFRYLGFLFGVALTSAGLQGKRVRALAVAVIVSLGLNIVLLPTVGVAGALIAGTAGWVINCALLLPGVHRSFGRVLSLRDLARSFGVALAASGAGLLVRAVAPEALADALAGVAFAVVVLVGILGSRSWVLPSGKPVA